MAVDAGLAGMPVAPDSELWRRHDFAGRVAGPPIGAPWSKTRQDHTTAICGPDAPRIIFAPSAYFMIGGLTGRGTLIFHHEMVCFYEP